MIDIVKDQSSTFPDRNATKKGGLNPRWREISPPQVTSEDGEEIPVIMAANKIREKIINLMEGNLLLKESDMKDRFGCQNAKALDKFLNEFVPRHDGALVFIDFRYFKPINDAYGHKEGDKILQEFVDQINANFRTVHGEDILFRAGGDEFVLVCQYQETADFDTFINKIKEKLKSLVIHSIINHKGQDIEVSIGLDYGVVTYKAAKNQSDRPNFSELKHQADVEMYKYKQAQHKLAESGNQAIQLGR